MTIQPKSSLFCWRPSKAIPQPGRSWCVTFCFEMAVLRLCMVILLENAYRLVQSYIPNSFRVQCPRRFLQLGPDFLHTCSMCICRAFYEWGFWFFFFFLLFRQIFGFLYILGYLGLKGFHISSEKKKEATRQRLGRGALNTCAKFPGLIPQERRGQLDFVR